MSKRLKDTVALVTGGAIINLAPIVGLISYLPCLLLSDGFNPYSHSTGGVVQVIRELGIHFSRENIRVNAICPGFVYTPLIAGLADEPDIRSHLVQRDPIGRLAEPEGIANVVSFLASDEASYATAAVWTADGGYTAS